MCRYPGRQSSLYRSLSAQLWATVSYRRLPDDARVLPGPDTGDCFQASALDGFALDGRNGGKTGQWSGSCLTLHGGRNRSIDILNMQVEKMKMRQQRLKLARFLLYHNF
jgi:hypothetical protein